MHEVTEDTDGLFLGEVASGEEPCMADINIGSSKVTFKVDTGADVTASEEGVGKDGKSRGHSSSVLSIKP